MGTFKTVVSVIAISVFLAIAMPSGASQAPAAKIWTVVIDAGHGAHDPGCVASDGKTFEKDIALDVAVRLGEKIGALPSTRVVLTRSDDTFLSLSKRSDIANAENADLFISVHVNAQDKGTSANGFSIHCLGPSSRKGRDTFNENFNICKRENAVITLEDDYKTSYQGFDPNDPASYMIFSLMQNANLSNSLEFASDVDNAMRKYSPIKNSRGVSQDPFLVLVRASMPAVLFEMGFISNKGDFDVMTTEDGRDKIAEGLYQAFLVYRGRIDGAPVQTPAVQPQGESKTENEAKPKQETKTEAETKPAEPVKTESVASLCYGTQIIATGAEISSDDPFFKGYAPLDVPRGTLHRYIIGVSTDLAKAREENKKIKAFFPDSFLVKIEDGKTSLVK